MLEKLWYKIRPRIAVKRLYKYGTVGLHTFDDRNWREKLADMVDKFFEREAHRNRQIMFRKYFDISLGIWINDKMDRRAIEKARNGEWVKMDDVHEANRKVKKYNDEMQVKRCEQRLKEITRDIKNGRSFVRENLEHREKCLRELQHPTKIPVRGY